MDLELLRQGAVTLSKCGAVQRTDPDVSVVSFERKILVPMVLQPNQTYTFTKEISGETVLELRAISSDQTSNQITGVRLQIQLPNGRYLFGGNGIDIGQFAWVGSFRYLLDPPCECEPGSKILVTLTDTVGLGAAFPCNLVFEGCFNWYLKGGKRIAPPPAVSKQPRYQGIVNENVLAPCWVAGYGPSTPDGYEDTVFTYSSPLVTFNLAGPLYATIKTPIDNGIDFQMRRVLVDLTSDVSVAQGAVLGRIRAGAGYSLSDDFINLSALLAGAELAHDWKVRGGDAIYTDLQVVDPSGNGNIYYQLHFEGVKRRKL